MAAHLARTTILLLAIAVASGCGDKSKNTPGDTEEDDGAADADADATEDAAEEDGPSGTLSVLVLGERLWPDYERRPVEGAIVALDEPGGGRTEATTDSEGRALFDGLDWSLGTASATAYGGENRGLGSVVGIDGSEEDVNVYVPSYLGAPTDWIEISGTALNMDDPVGHSFEIIAVEFPSLSPFSPDWSLDVPPAVPFTLVAKEWDFVDLPSVRGMDRPVFGWIVSEQTAVTAPTTVDMDFAFPTASTTVSGTFSYPSRLDSPLRDLYPLGWLDARVMVSEVEAMIISPFGAVSHTEVTTDGNTAEYDFEFVTLTDLPDPVTEFDLVSDWSGSRTVPAIAYVRGYPTEGAQDFSFLDQPRMVVPSSGTVRHPLHDPVEWELFDTGVRPVIVIGRRDTGRYVWTVVAPEDATTLTVPEPPSGVDMAALLGTHDLGFMFRIVSSTPTEACFWRSTEILWFTMANP